MSMFDGFEARSIDVGETTIVVRYAGSGRGVLLLHGFPETHLMCRGIAPVLARDHSVVCADLRGYGASGTPPSAPDHRPYSKRAMARDLVHVMDALGLDVCSVVGHDRGGRVAYRMTLDHPDRVQRLAVLDIVPTLDAMERADARLALTFWPWSLLAQPAPLPERLIAGDPEAVILDAMTQWDTRPESFGPDVRAAYVKALRDPAHVHAICEEYGAAATLDVEHDRADRTAGRRIACPTLVLWAARSTLDTWYEDAGGPLAIWRAWAPQVTGRAVAGGHFFPEERPEETAAMLHAFLAEEHR